MRLGWHVTSSSAVPGVDWEYMIGDWKRTKHKKDRRNNNDKQLEDSF